MADQGLTVAVTGPTGTFGFGLLPLLLPAEHQELDLHLLRPPVVLGPHAVGGKDLLPGPLAPLARAVQG